MVESEQGSGVLELLDQLCMEALQSESLSQVKENFRKVGHSDLDQLDVIARTAVEREIGQILNSRTVERARYYAKNLQNGLKTYSKSDADAFNINLWKGYDHIITGSLWNFGPRARGGQHKGWYWGNFIPQIPFQLISRYTKPGDWVVDPFCGSGTTLLEAMKLGRNSLGVELNSEVYQKTTELFNKASAKANARAVLELQDSMEFDFPGFVEKEKIPKFKLAILHPPYWDIIKFSENPRDLSMAKDSEDFTTRLANLAKGILPAMGHGSHIGLVIGDIYRNGEVIPLGFRSMDALSNLGLKLRGIIVKDIQNTRAKRNSENLWRYRALKSGFYVFKHEYVFVFKYH